MATKANKEEEKMKARAAAKKAEAKAKADKKAQVSASLRPVPPEAEPLAESPRELKIGDGICPCGCNQQTNGKSLFAQGHDARIKGWLIRNAKGKSTLDDKPAIIRKMAEEWKGQQVKALLQAVMLGSKK